VATTLYYGDAGVSAVDGNWNTVANWFTSLWFCCDCCQHAGTPAGRVPAAGDTVILTYGASVSHPTITTGPSGGFSGPIEFYQGNAALPSSNTFIAIAAGSYSGNLTLGAAPSASAPPNTSQLPGITGGSYSGTVALTIPGGGALASATIGISGGTFTGKVTRPAPPTGPTALHTFITGGTYKPSASCALGPGDVLEDANLPEDPGFAVGGGTFAPIITVTNLPSGGSGKTVYIGPRFFGIAYYSP
jgi:hypothetical protein